MHRHRVGFLLFDQFEDLDFFGPWEIFAIWRDHFNGPNELLLLSEGGGWVTSAKGLTLQVTSDLSSCPALDYLLIPGGLGTRKAVENPSILQFIQAQALRCRHILSVCTGAFLLQAAGLLANRQATTHWESVARLAHFPEVTVTATRYTRDDNLWTAAGVSAGIDMALAFVAAVAGEQTAGDIQLYAEYYPAPTIYPNRQNILPKYVVEK